ncbi:hypothetical protein AB0L40_13000 [Patulibacter sp. NPDC049589]|uniref:hypothetical protein n=1 Tax=Patulibacter sp. NPDC049589 TaxID=3154731 RepID=UPI00341E30E2
MAVPHANRPRPATLLGCAASGLLLSQALHWAPAPAVVAGLAHLAVLPLVAALVLVLLAPRAGGRPTSGEARTMLAVILLAAAGPEAVAVARDAVQHGHEGALGHLLHAAPPVLALLAPVLLAAAGISWVLVLAARPDGGPGVRVSVTALAARGPGSAGRCARPHPARAGRSAGRAPPRVLPA